MPASKLSDAEFIELWNTHKSAKKIREVTGIELSNIYRRRRSLEQIHKIKLAADDYRAQKFEHLHTAHHHAARYNLGIENGTVLCFSDAHFWPGIRSTAFKGLLWAIDTFKPKAIINGGDAFDGASISRHPRIGWASPPSIIGELKACEAALSEIEEAAKAARRNTKLVWTLGNHDMRLESRLAANVPEFQGVKGFTLGDHFPAWHMCWSAWLTEDVIVKHRWKGGIHATHGNTSMSGKSMVTGHLHSLKVTPYCDYNGNRFGIDTGTLAEIDGPQFSDYLEDAPVNWRSGFAVLTFNNGRLLWPEIVHRFDDDRIEFRGEVLDVSAL
jgi:hypothetical protein